MSANKPKRRRRGISQVQDGKSNKSPLAIGSNNILAIIDMNGQIETANNGFYHLFGLPENNNKNLSITKYIPDFHPSKYNYNVKETFYNQVLYKDLFTGVNINREEFDLDLRMYPMTINKKKMLLLEARNQYEYTTDDIPQEEINMIERHEKDIINMHHEMNSNLPVAMYSYNQKAKTFNFISCGIKAITGFTDKELMEGVVNWDTIIHPEDLDLIRADRKDSLYRKEHYRLSYRITTRDNDVKWIYEHGFGKYDALNQITGTEGFIYDYTQQKVTQDLVQKKLKMYQLMSENSSDLAFLLYPDYRMRFISDSVKEILGFSPSELQDKPFIKTVYSKDRGKFSEETLANVLAGEEYKKILYRSEKKNGEKIWLEAIIKPFRNLNNKIRGIQVVSRDVSQTIEREKKLKKYAAEIREKTMLMTSILDTMAESVVVLDKKGDYKLMNKTARQIYGINGQKHTPDHALHPPIFYDMANNRQLEEEELPAKKALKGESFDNFETYIKNLYSETGFYASMNTRPMIGPDGKIQGSITVLRDIDSSKKMQFAIEKEKEKAEYAASVKTQFLSNMSHEIRTPLNGIMALINFLMENDPRTDQQEHLKLLKFSSDHLMSLINNVLDLNKLEEGKLELEYREWSLEGHLNNLFQMYEMKARDKGIQMAIEIDKRIDHHYAYDKVRLTQIISNLINNAIKFTDAGEVSLKARCLEISEDKSVIRFEIADTGIGIEKEKIERIFERFSQADSTISAKYGGSGLGLSISKKLLALMHSDLKLKSKLGTGTVFYFDLSLERGAKNTDSIENEVNRSSITPQQDFDILVVDDNEVNLLVAEKYLKGWGGRVDKATGGKDALKMIRQKHFDMVLLDIQMPDLDGLEVTRRIRNMKDKPFHSIPIIAISAAVLKHQKDEAMEAGVDAYVTKPFDPDDLRATISKYLKTEMNREPKSVSLEGPKEDTADSAKEHMIEAIEFYSEGEEEFRNEFIRTLVNGLEEFNEKSREHIKERDLDSFRQMHHKIKSNLKILKLDKISTLCDEMKSVLRREKGGDPDKMFSEIEKLTANSINILIYLKDRWDQEVRKSA